MLPLRHKSRILVKMIVAVLEEMVNLETRQEVDRLVEDAQGREIVCHDILPDLQALLTHG